MGNCQAIDAATLVIQHPSGKVENLYWPVSASEVMKTNPGHYVALLLSTTLYNSSTSTANSTATNNGPLRVTRIKLLRPTDTLALGHCYRLITTQEVTKGLRAKKQAKGKTGQHESAEEPEKVVRQRIHGSRSKTEAGRSEQQKEHQVTKNERSRPKAATSSTNSAVSTGRPRTWQPSLHSISEAGSGS